MVHADFSMNVGVAFDLEMRNLSDRKIGIVGTDGNNLI